MVSRASSSNLPSAAASRSYHSIPNYVDVHRHSTIPSFDSFYPHLRDWLNNMVILEENPKLPTDPSAGPTNREDLQPDPAASGSSSRPPSPNPTLPDYETSQAQLSPNRKPWRSWKFWHSRIGKLVSYALVVYSSVVFIIAVPAFVLVRFLISTSSFPCVVWDTQD